MLVESGSGAKHLHRSIEKQAEGGFLHAVSLYCSRDPLTPAPSVSCGTNLSQFCASTGASLSYVWKCSRTRILVGPFHQQYPWKSHECYASNLNEAHTHLYMPFAFQLHFPIFVCQPLFYSALYGVFADLLAFIFFYYLTCSLQFVQLDLRQIFLS